MRDGAADEDVVERRHRHVEVSIDISPGRITTTLVFGKLRDPVDPGLVLPTIDHVDLTGLEREIAAASDGM